MTLVSFLEKFNLIPLKECSSPLSVTGVLKTDSRNIEPGDVYLSMPIADLNLSKTYQDQARQRGAALILILPEARILWSQWAKHCFSNQPKTCVAVTGTSGKTSVVEFARQLWQHSEFKSASIGTLGLISEERPIQKLDSAVTLTTPDSYILHQMLHQLAGHDIQHVAVEVSSHGLDQHRSDQVVWSAAAFTNLSHEHLDYHQTMENYFHSKSRLFQETAPLTSFAILNRDSPYGVRLGHLCKKRGLRMLWFGHKEADLATTKIEKHTKGMTVDFNILGQKAHIDLPMIGSFQVENILAALGLTISTGLDINQALQGLSHLKGVPGRMDYVGETAQGGAVYVDYAHKPLALEHVLKTARAHTTGHVSVVFGCGGNRDCNKRSMMGEIAQALADEVYVTDDNPRNESPESIRAAILSKCSKAVEIPSRAQAIAKALSKCKRGDICIIAGKGHETGQTIKDCIIPFDDKTIAQQFL